MHDKDKANINFTIYLTADELKELERQADLYSAGVKSHYARWCLKETLLKVKRQELESQLRKNDLDDAIIFE